MHQIIQHGILFLLVAVYLALPSSVGHQALLICPLPWDQTLFQKVRLRSVAPAFLLGSKRGLHPEIQGAWAM